MEGGEIPTRMRRNKLYNALKNLNHPVWQFYRLSKCIVNNSSNVPDKIPKVMLICVKLIQSWRSLSGNLGSVRSK